MPFDRQSLARLGAKVDAADGLFQGSSFTDIGNDKDLTEFLQRWLFPGGNPSVEDLRRKTLDIAREWRGEEWWVAFYDVPRRIPDDIAHHRKLNLAERLYLSAPGNHGRQPVFGDEAADRSLWQQRVYGRSTLAAGAPVAGIALVSWVLVRRSRSGGAERPFTRKRRASESSSIAKRR